MANIVLLLDDDAAALAFLEGVLTAADISCLTTSEPKQALAIAQSRPDITLIISDICMPTMNGIQFADRLNSLALQWRVPSVLFLTAHPTLERAVDALRLGAYDFLRKPVRPTELLEAVRHGLERAERRRVAPVEGAPDVEKLIRQAEQHASGDDDAVRPRTRLGTRHDRGAAQTSTPLRRSQTGRTGVGPAARIASSHAETQPAFRFSAGDFVSRHADDDVSATYRRVDGGRVHRARAGFTRPQARLPDSHSEGSGAVGGLSSLRRSISFGDPPGSPGAAGFSEASLTPHATPPPARSKIARRTPSRALKIFRLSGRR